MGIPCFISILTNAKLILGLIKVNINSSLYKEYLYDQGTIQTHYYLPALCIGKDCILSQ
jgi:hypothetical protein